MKGESVPEVTAVLVKGDPQDSGEEGEGKEGGGGDVEIKSKKKKKKKKKERHSESEVWSDCAM